jgi:hypothetical protein
MLQLEHYGNLPHKSSEGERSLERDGESVEDGLHTTQLLLSLLFSLSICKREFLYAYSLEN